MPATRDLRLAVTLIRGAGRRDLTRIVAMSLGVGLAVFASLVGIAAPRVAALAHQVEVARSPVFEESGSSSEGLRMRITDEVSGDRPWTRAVVNGARPGLLLPPGLSIWPEAGDTVPSPALRRQAELDPRVQARLGRLAALDISPRGLTGPDELFSYTVIADQVTAVSEPDPAGGSPEPVVVGYGNSEQVAGGGLGMLLVIEIGLLVITPAAIFLLAALRLSAVSRSRRSFALGLAGMSPRRNAQLYAWEMTVVAAVGLLIAAVAYNTTQANLGASGLLGVSWWPYQGHLNWLTLAVAVVIAIWLVRFLARRTMIAVASRTRSKRTSRQGRLLAGGALVLGVPAIGFLGMVCLRGRLDPSTDWASDGYAQLVAIAIVAATAAVILGVPTLIEVIGKAAGARVRPAWGLGLLGAAFRIPSTRRLIAFVAGAVMLAGLSNAFLISLRQSAFGDPADATIRFSSEEVAADPRWFVDLPQGPFTIDASVEGEGGTYSVAIGNCPGIERQAAAVFSQPGPCRDAIQRGNGGAGGASVTSISVGSVDISVPREPLTSNVTWDLKFPVRDAPWAQDLADGTVTYWVSRSDGSYEAALSALSIRFPGLSLDAGLKDPTQFALYQQQVGTVRAATGLGILLSLCSFVLSAVENRWERTRSVATLAAIGTPHRVLRLANSVEFTFPVVVATLPAGLIGVLGGWAVVSFRGTRGMFSSQVFWWTAYGAGAAIVIAATIGWATGAARFRREAIADV